MNATIPELLTAWEFYPVSAAVMLTLFLPYVWGWLRMRRTRAQLATTARLISFVAGISALGLALHSPLVALQQELLIGRAAQQILVGLLAPPLLWLACPAHVILRGLPASSRRWGCGQAERVDTVRGASFAEPHIRSCSGCLHSASFCSGTSRASPTGFWPILLSTASASGASGSLTCYSGGIRWEPVPVCGRQCTLRSRFSM